MPFHTYIQYILYRHFLARISIYCFREDFFSKKFENFLSIFKKRSDLYVKAFSSILQAFVSFFMAHLDRSSDERRNACHLISEYLTCSVYHVPVFPATKKRCPRWSISSVLIYMYYCSSAAVLFFFSLRYDTMKQIKCVSAVIVQEIG